MNVEDSASWVMKVRLSDKGEFVKVDTKRNSMVIWHDWPESILEYSPGKVIFALRPNTSKKDALAKFLFVQDWLPVRHLDQAKSNINQMCIKAHPRFDEKDFPFLICSG